MLEKSSKPLVSSRWNTQRGPDGGGLYRVDFFARKRGVGGTYKKKKPDHEGAES